MRVCGVLEGGWGFYEVREGSCRVERADMREGDPWARFKIRIRKGNIIRRILCLIMRCCEVMEGEGYEYNEGKEIMCRIREVLNEKRSVGKI